MARVKISAVYDSFAKEDQPPVLVLTDGDNGREEHVILVGEGKEFDIEKIRRISLAPPSNPSRANELTKPVSDMSAVKPTPEGAVAETPPIKPIGEQTGLALGEPARTAPADNPGGTQPNPSATQPGVSSQGMQNSLGGRGAPTPSEVRDPAEPQKHPTDPLSLLK